MSSCTACTRSSRTASGLAYIGTTLNTFFAQRRNPMSIEMFEAVGHHCYDDFFRQRGRRLKTAGVMLLQAITIADQRYDAAHKSVDFIQRHIFPDSCIRSVTVMANAIARVIDLKLFQLEDIGPHCATTLRHWRENL